MPRTSNARRRSTSSGSRKSASKKSKHMSIKKDYKSYSKSHLAKLLKQNFGYSGLQDSTQDELIAFLDAEMANPENQFMFREEDGAVVEKTEIKENANGSVTIKETIMPASAQSAIKQIFLKGKALYPDEGESQVKFTFERCLENFDLKYIREMAKLKGIDIKGIKKKKQICEVLSSFMTKEHQATVTVKPDMGVIKMFNGIVDSGIPMAPALNDVGLHREINLAKAQMAQNAAVEKGARVFNDSTVDFNMTPALWRELGFMQCDMETLTSPLVAVKSLADGNYHWAEPKRVMSGLNSMQFDFGDNTITLTKEEIAQRVWC